MALPALRNLDITPVEHEGQTLVALRDPEGYAEETLVLSPAAFFIATCLNGTNDTVDIQYEFAKQFTGVVLTAENIMQIVRQLDEHGFLLSGQFTQLRDRAIDVFAKSPVRPAYFAGKSYPEEPNDLREFLREMLSGENQSPQSDDTSASPLRCLIVPHIDFDRGRTAYAHGYTRLAREPKPNTIFIFGVAHAGPAAPYILTKKHFDTPLGQVPVDGDIVDRLASICTWSPFEHELIHRTEHSIEFQAVLLAQIFGKGPRIVPILCGPLPLTPGTPDPVATPEIEVFLEECHAIAAEDPQSTIVVAGADLAHVGRRFGDDIDVTDEVLRDIETRDRQDLAFVQAGDAPGFYRSVMKDHNARQVCGLSCIYSALRTVQDRVEPGILLHYGRAPDPIDGVVSFASLCLPAGD